MTALILPPASALYSTFSELLSSADLVFFAGLPGVGKSLLLQQLALMAAEAGRPVHLLQWDVARQPFESRRYPLIDGATHPLVIKAVGQWARGAVAAWHDEFGGQRDMLIGEAPLIGGRFMELVRPADDAAEALLTSRRTRFVLPIPSREVRAAIEGKRGQSIAAPRHENEAHDAPPELLRALWGDLNLLAFQLGLVDSPEISPYSPAVYASVYDRLLSNRRHLPVNIDQLLPSSSSVYAGMDGLPNLRAGPEEAARILRRPAAATPAAAGPWHEI